jgi:hypothetical protein
MIETIGFNPLFRMAERVSPRKVGQVRADARRLRRSPLATLDEPCVVKKMACMRTMDQ